jgi:hypothetical protein
MKYTSQLVFELLLYSWHDATIMCWWLVPSSVLFSLYFASIQELCVFVAKWLSSKTWTKKKSREMFCPGYRSFSRPRPALRCVAKSMKSAHAHWVVGKWEPFRNDIAMCNGGREKDLYPGEGLYYVNRPHHLQKFVFFDEVKWYLFAYSYFRWQVLKVMLNAHNRVFCVKELTVFQPQRLPLLQPRDRLAHLNHQKVQMQGSSLG